MDHMNKQRLLTATAVAELGAGAGLLLLPAKTATLLLGSALASPESLIVGRVAGAALLALALTCWLERTHTRTYSTIGLIAGPLLYNVLAVVLLVYAAVVARLSGVGTWPVIGLHAALLAWCVGVPAPDVGWKPGDVRLTL